jgi:hypothetical protein
MKMLPQTGSLVLGLALSSRLNGGTLTIPEIVANARPAQVKRL